jgi:hypothetical protein
VCHEIKFRRDAQKGSNWPKLKGD